MKTFQLPTKDSTQAFVKSYTVGLSPVDAVCILCPPGGEWSYAPGLYRHTDCCFCTCFTNANIWGLPKAQGTCTVICISYCDDVLQGAEVSGDTKVGSGLPSLLTLLWLLFVLPIGAAEQTWSQIQFSTLCRKACLHCSVVSFTLSRSGEPLAGSSKHLGWYVDPGLLLNDHWFWFSW